MSGNETWKCFSHIARSITCCTASEASCERGFRILREVNGVERRRQKIDLIRARLFLSDGL